MILITTTSCRALSEFLNSLNSGVRQYNEENNYQEYDYQDAPSQRCFGATTLVVMADGSLKAIDKIVVGDYVLSFDEKKPLTDKLEPKKVLKTISTPNTPIVKAGGLVTTLGHCFVSPEGKWVKIRHLKAAKTIDCVTVKIECSEVIGNDRVYNIEVEDYHTYIVVGDEKWRVHNKAASNQGSRCTSI